MWQIKCVFWHAIRYGTLYTVIAVLSVLLYSCREKSNPTLPSVLPRLSHPPNTTAIGTSYAVVKWQEQHTGDGPICAYAIDRRMLGEDVPSWLTAVFVSEQLGSHSKEELVFNLTGLEPETDYQVSVRPILCDGARVSELGEGPILSLTTPIIVLPTLMEAPQSTNMSSTHVTIRWTNQHQGDGPICGYGINIKNNDDKDRGDDESSDAWRSVGYVSMESELLYDVGHLEANTTYQVIVSPINCISAREGPREPILQFTTKTVTVSAVVLPNLSHPPSATAIGTSYATIQWQEQHTGDGPICAYAIDRRMLGEAIPSWLSVGFVSEQLGSQSKEELVFNLTGLEPETDYQVSVRPILCDGTRASELGEGPILSLTMPSIGWSYQTQASWHLLPGTQCNGNSQSPINIISSIATPTDLGPFVLDGYTDENPNMDLVNNGRGVSVQLHEEVDDLYKLSGGGLPTTYTAVQFHFHWGCINSQGSEHQIDGVAYPAELHMIHYDKSKYTSAPAALASSQWDAVTLLVVMIEVGESNTAFDSFLSYISQIANYSSGITSLGQGNLPSFPIRNVLPSDLSKFYRYNGSKALPNCDESIIHTIFKDPISISQAQLDIFRTMYGNMVNAQGNYKIVDNYRYIQPLNGRTIYYSSHVQLPSHQ